MAILVSKSRIMIVAAYIGAFLMIRLSTAHADGKQAKSPYAYLDDIQQFNLHRHLMTPSTKDLQDGVHNSKRLAHNAQRLGLKSPFDPSEQSHREDIVVNPPDLLVKRFNSTEFGSGRIKVDEKLDPLPFGEGPGIFPNLPHVRILILLCCINVMVYCHIIFDSFIIFI